jgi:hypothetical protein
MSNLPTITEINAKSSKNPIHFAHVVTYKSRKSVERIRLKIESENLLVEYLEASGDVWERSNFSSIGDDDKSIISSDVGLTGGASSFLTASGFGASTGFGGSGSGDVEAATGRGCSGFASLVSVFRFSLKESL